MVKRLFVEKKPGFDVEAGHVKADLCDSLGLDAEVSLRLLCRYDVEGVSEEEYTLARDSIFSEPNVDNVFDEAVDLSGWRHFTTEYLPGQYDQRADSAAQCIQLLTQGERPRVASAKTYALRGNLSDEMFEKIRHYLVNPVESRIASDAKPESLDMPFKAPEKVELLTGFTKKTDAEIAAYHKATGFAMTVADLCFCRDYFKSEGRDPFITELKVIDTYWSDHCRHTTFLTTIEELEIENAPLSAAIREAFKQYLAARKAVYGDREKDITLMDMATMGAKYLKKQGKIPDLDESEEINACSINAVVEIDGEKQDWLIQFKNETHNHPTEIEPFGGAATCLGGAIRDPLSGRAYVYQAMRVTGSGDPTVPFADTLPGKLPQKKITTGAAHGYSSYGNQIGLATGQVVELYHPGYVAKRMEIGAVVGAGPKENVFRGTPAPGDIIVLLGGRTGRDGCGGATGSSKAHDSASIETCGAEVQKGNPPTERKLQRLFRNGEAAKMIKRCNDFGAGGVCVAIGELADGLDIDLDAVPKKYEGLDGTELAISESQERMAVVLEKADVERFISLAGSENLEATPVAVVTDKGRLHMQWRGETVVDLSRAFLNTNGVTGKAAAKITPPDPSYREAVPAVLQNKSVVDAFADNLSRLEVCAQKGLAERFDASIGASSVLMPFGGKHQLTPEEAMVAKIPLEQGETDDATAMSFGAMPGLLCGSPFHGAVMAVMESLAKLAAVGADPAAARLTFQEYFERLGDKPERWGKPAAALLGAFAAQLGMGVPSIGGKDSMSGSFNELDVPPTLVSFALAMTKASATASAAFKKAGSPIALLSLPMADDQPDMPDFAAAKRLNSAVAAALREGKFLSASVVKEGGAAACVAKMGFGNGLGADFASEDAALLFAPAVASFVVEAADEAALDDFAYTLLGKTNGDGLFRFPSGEISVEAAKKRWLEKLEGVFPLYSDAAVEMTPTVPLYSEKSGRAPAIKAAKPRVFIPVFPGTNCEVDTARAFARAGAEPEIFVVKNLSSREIEESAAYIAAAIDRAQIVMLPGGFSGGDEPDGSGKFIATTFRGARVREAVDRLLSQRDGLMLGICNGFQALIKLGLVPYGEIRAQKPEDPTLTFNTLGRHISRMVYTRVTSVKSPWLSLCEAGEVHAVPVSHGEGRFVADRATVERLAANGQIATQYVDLSGNPTADIEFNPNGSVCAIEGITSPDGRVLGKMGHSERCCADCYGNVPGEKDQKLFAAGVRYFK